MSSTLINVTDNPAPGASNFSPASADVAVGANVTLKSSGAGTINVYTWIGDPSPTNGPQAIFTSGNPPYAAPKSEGHQYTLKPTIPAGTKISQSVNISGGGMNGTINVKPG